MSDKAKEHSESVRHGTLAQSNPRIESPGPFQEAISETQAICLALADLGQDAPIEKVQAYLQNVGLYVDPTVIHNVISGLEGQRDLDVSSRSTCGQKPCS